MELYSFASNPKKLSTELKYKKTHIDAFGASVPQGNPLEFSKPTLKFKIKRPATKTALGDKKATRSYLENYLSSIVIFFPFVCA